MHLRPEGATCSAQIKSDALGTFILKWCLVVEPIFRGESTMRRLFLSVALLTVVITTGLTQTAPKPQSNTDAEQTVLKLTRAWLEAEERQDRVMLRRIIADDFQGTAPTGHTVFKEDVIPQEGTQSRGLAVSVQDVKARVFGETAVVTGSGVPKSGEKGELRFTVIYTKRGDNWQMVAGHLSVPRE
jgi:ketosteroid isomerase-like protein